MENNKKQAKSIKNSGYIFALIVAVGGAVLSVITGSWIWFLIAFIIGIAVGNVYFALGAILEEIIRTNELLSVNTKPEKVEYNTKETTPVYKSKTTQLAEKITEVNSNEQVKKTWKCKCGFENLEYADSCRSCGEYK